MDIADLTNEQLINEVKRRDFTLYQEAVLGELFNSDKGSIVLDNPLFENNLWMDEITIEINRLLNTYSGDKLLTILENIK